METVVKRMAINFLGMLFGFLLTSISICRLINWKRFSQLTLTPEGVTRVSCFGKDIFIPWDSVSEFRSVNEWRFPSRNGSFMPYVFYYLKHYKIHLYSTQSPVILSQELYERYTAGEIAEILNEWRIKYSES